MSTRHMNTNTLSDGVNLMNLDISMHVSHARAHEVGGAQYTCTPTHPVDSLVDVTCVTMECSSSGVCIVLHNSF